MFRLLFYSSFKPTTQKQGVEVLSRIVWAIGYVGVGAVSLLDDLVAKFTDGRDDAAIAAAKGRHPAGTARDPLEVVSIPDAARRAQPADAQGTEIVSISDAAEEAGVTVAELIGMMVDDGLILPVPGQPGRFVPGPHPDIRPIESGF